MESKVLKDLYESLDRGRGAGLVIITERSGSIPGEEGMIMAVFEDGTSSGTIGGGALEYEVLQRTIRAIAEGQGFAFDYDLNESSDLAMVCGGKTKGYVKVFNPKETLIIFGAGHVGQKLARIGVATGFQVYVSDDREDFKDHEDFKGIKSYLVGRPDEVLDDLPFNKENTYIVICTRGHDHDQVALEGVLNKDYRYLGVLGSKRKVARTKDLLEEKGFDKEKIQQIHMPIGLDLDNGRVEEIGISIMAEILKEKNSGTGLSHRDILKGQDRAY